MGAMASQITSLTIVYLIVQIKENIKAPRHWPFTGNSPANGEMFPFDDVIMEYVNPCRVNIFRKLLDIFPFSIISQI